MFRTTPIRFPVHSLCGRPRFAFFLFLFLLSSPPARLSSPSLLPRLPALFHGRGVCSPCVTVTQPFRYTNHRVHSQQEQAFSLPVVAIVVALWMQRRTNGRNPPWWTDDVYPLVETSMEPRDVVPSSPVLFILFFVALLFSYLLIFLFFLRHDYIL